MKKSIICIFILSVVCNYAFSQEKYAVLIIGDEASMEEGKTRTLNDPNNENLVFSPYGEGSGKWYNPMEEFWFDAVIMYNALLDEGYTDDNIFLLFGKGYDYEPSTYPIAPKYNPSPNITDYPARVDDVENIFEWLRFGNASQGIPAITNDDFLFVWTFGHGGFKDLNGNNQWDEGEEVLICLIDDLFQNAVYDAMMDSDFSTRLNLISCNRRSIWMQQCHGGGFVQYLENNKSTIVTACHASESAWPADNLNIYGGNIEEWETIIFNQNEHTYSHGEFNLHIMASLVGEYPNGDIVSADINNDNEISVFESKDYNEDNNSRFLYSSLETPQWSDIGNIGTNTSLQYPTLMHTTLNNDFTARGLVGVSKDFSVQNTYTLTLKENAIVDIFNTADITIDIGANLVIEDDVILISKSGTRNIFVNGDISIGDNVKFKGENGGQLKIYLNNTSEILTIDNCEFTESAIDSDIASLTITNSEFNSGGIYGNNGDYTISNCDFDESFAHFPYTSAKSSKVTISSQCNFENSTIDAIRIFNYKNFEIKDCTIKSNDRNGIYLSNAGGGTVINEISDCEITQNNSTSYSGILMYNSTVDILDNYIDGNYYGIKCFNNSNTYIKGDYNTLTQQISNNTSYELYASYGNFPYYVRYNGFYDDDNPQPIIYYTTGLFSHTLDVRYNNWDANFNYLTDLYPASWYLWQPTWTPSAVKSGEVGESIYFSAKQKIEAEDYTGAKTDLMQVVKQYPQSPFAEAALRDIFDIEEYGENNFSTLKTYYDEDPYVQSTELLIRRGGFFANLCDVKLENWQNAIDWYENIIQYPISMEDSIFAIIDLGHLYLLMEEGGTKSTYNCKMPEHQPKSVTAYNEKKDYLLSLIPGEQLSDTLLTDLEEMKAGELLHNIPNPFNTSTQIWYKLNTDAVVSIEIFNATGKNIQTYNLGNADAGVNSVKFTPEKLTPGIYFYTLKVNGIVTDTKKMTIMK